MKISWKILLIALPLMAAGMLCLGFLNAYFTEEALDGLAGDWLDSRLSDALGVAVRARDDLRRPGSTATAEEAKARTLKAMGEMSFGRGGLILVLDGSGRVLAHPDRIPLHEDFAGAPWFKTVQSTPRGRISLNIGEADYEAAYDFFLPWGWHVLAAASRDRIFAPARMARLYGLLAAITGVIIAAGLLLVMARRLTGPLYALMDEAGRIASGDLSTPVSVSSRDEIGALASSFQKMKLRLAAVYQGLEERIEELRQAKEQLSLSETRLRRLSDATWEGIALHDEGRLVLANARFYALFGYEQGELTGVRTGPLTIAPECLDKLRADIEAGKDPVESVGVRKDGSRFTLEIRTGSIEYHGRMVRVTALRDISARKEAEMALRESEALFRGVISASQDAMAVLDRRGRIVIFNPAAERMFQRTAAEMRGAPPDALMPDASRRRIRGFIAAVVRGRLPEWAYDRVYEDTALRRDGEPFPVELSVSAAQNKGEPLILAVIRDISERKRAEERLAALNRDLEKLVEERTRDLAGKAEELMRANERLRELDAMKSSFLSSVSHELRTPLTSIMGFAKILGKTFRHQFRQPLMERRDLARKVDRFADNLGVIETEGERLTRLINDVLDLNKIESGAQEWRDRFVNPAELISHAARTVQGEISRNPLVRLKVETMGSLPGVRVDPDKFIQVLLNLLNNAAKFTDRGEVGVAAFTENGDFKVSVWDTGAGIAAEDLPRIFEKFQQGQGGALGDKPKGTGLGLCICKEIVEHYGGSIMASSEPGRGSRFTFSLPLRPDRPLPEQSPLKA